MNRLIGLIILQSILLAGIVGACPPDLIPVPGISDPVQNKTVLVGTTYTFYGDDSYDRDTLGYSPQIREYRWEIIPPDPYDVFYETTYNYDTDIDIEFDIVGVWTINLEVKDNDAPHWSDEDGDGSASRVVTVVEPSAFPKVKNVKIENVTDFCADVYGKLLHAGPAGTTCKTEVYWGTTEGGTETGNWDDGQQISSSEDVGDFSGTLTSSVNFERGSLYYFRFHAINNTNQELISWADIEDPNCYRFVTPPGPAGHYLSPGSAPDPNLVAYWEFEGDANDSAGNNDGLAHNVAWVDGVFGQAAEFSGIGNWHGAPESSFVEIDGSGTYDVYSIAMWFQTEGTSHYTMFSDAHEAGPDDYGKPDLGILGWCDKVYFSPRRQCFLYSETGYTDGQWHHAVGTINTYANVVQLYLDGILVGQKTYPTYPLILDNSHPGGYTSEDASNRCDIGARSRKDRYFAGKIDDVRIYDRVLEADEIGKMTGTHVENVSTSPILRWISSRSDYQVLHDVYFGTDSNVVESANRDSDEYKGRYTMPVYHPGELENDTTYYWRVDEIVLDPYNNNDERLTRGSVWSFTTKRGPVLTVAASSGGTVWRDPDLPVYEEGTKVSLTASALTNYRFDHWEGDLTSGQNPNSSQIEVVMDRDRTLAAIFSINPTLEVTVVPESGGNVIVNPDAAYYSVGDEVILTAAADPYYHFDHWEGDLSGMQTTETIVMNRPKSVRAVFSRKVCYVSVAGDDANSGLSWAEAFGTPQKALAIAEADPNYQVWVAGGTYYPDEGPGQMNDDRTSTFALVDGVEIYGGFAGDEMALEERNIAANPTIFSGDIDQDDNGWIPDFENSYHILTVASNACVDGFTVIGGVADGNDLLGGGGLLIYDANDVVVRNCYFSCNNAADTHHGGGVYNNGEQITFVNCIFSGNSAAKFNDLTEQIDYGNGGAIYTNGTLDLINCTICDNAADYGAGLYAASGNVGIHNSIFWNNESTVSGRTIQDAQLYADGSGSITASYSCIQDGDAQDEAVYSGTGNIDQFPKFIIAGGWEGAALPGSIMLQATLRDFRGFWEYTDFDSYGDPNEFSKIYPDNGHPDFEQYNGPEKGIVGYPGQPSGVLDLPDRKPIYNTAVKGTSGENSLTTTGPDNFNVWYIDTPSYNRKTTINLILTREGNTTVYSYNNPYFFPIDDRLFGEDAPYSGKDKSSAMNPHHYHFTMELHTDFYYDPAATEHFEINGSDDDMYVYMNDKLVIDLGGVHSAQFKRVLFDANDILIYDRDGSKWESEPSDVVSNVFTGAGNYTLDLFFAERHQRSSNLRFATSLELQQPEFTPGDYHLQAESPCIDAGDNMALPAGLAIDLDGHARRIDDPNTSNDGHGTAPIVDIGAFEYYVNQAPLVDAGADIVCAINKTIVLNDANVLDDGLPNPALLDISWECIDGPGQVVWRSADTISHPSVFFPIPGVYTLELTADDGEFCVSDTVSVTAVRVDAGPDRVVWLDGEGTADVSLDAAIEGAVPDSESVIWAVTSSPAGSGCILGEFSESDPNLTITVDMAGVYVLELAAGFSGAVFADDAVVTVRGDAAGNSLPDLRAWAEPEAVEWPANAVNLRGWACDDGLPEGYLGVEWEKFSGPAGSEVTFGAYSAEDVNTTATFSRPGRYVLKLSAWDVFEGDGQAVERFVLVTVADGDGLEDNGRPVVDAGEDVVVRHSPIGGYEYVLSQVDISDPTPTAHGLNVQWYIEDGTAGGMAFDDSTAVNPVVTFFAEGEYELFVTADDGEFAVSDTLVVTALDEAPVVEGIQIDAGEDAVVILPDEGEVTHALSGWCSSVPAGLFSSTEWQVVVQPEQSGMQFEPALPAVSVWDPNVTFTTGGDYVFRLAAKDGGIFCRAC